MCEQQLIPGRIFHVLYHRVEFLHEGVHIITNAIKIGAEPYDALDYPTGLFDMFLTHLMKRKLHFVKGESVLAVDGRGRAKAHQSLISGRKRGVARAPACCRPPLLQHRIGRFREITRYDTEGFLNFIVNFLSCHLIPPTTQAEDFPKTVLKANTK